MKGVAVDLIVKIVLAIIAIIVGYLIFSWIINHFPTILDWICNVPIIKGLDYCKEWKETRAIQEYHLYPGEEEAIIKDKGYIVRKGAFVEYEDWNEETPLVTDLKMTALHCPDNYKEEKGDNIVCHVFVKTKEANYKYVIYIVPLCFGDLKKQGSFPGAPLSCEVGKEALQIKIEKLLVPDVTKRETSVLDESPPTILSKDNPTFNWNEVSFTLLELKGRRKTIVGHIPGWYIDKAYEFEWMFEFKGEESLPKIGCCQFSPSPQTINCDMVTKEECEMIYHGSWDPNAICEYMGMGQIRVCVPQE
jgi:hypothetical protein